MDGVIVNLDGEEHLARRRLEDRLFRRDTFAWYEHERIPTIIDDVLREPVEQRRGELISLARRTMLSLSLEVAGIDRPSDDVAALDDLYALMDRLARASTVARATGDKTVLIADGDDALAHFSEAYFRPSRDRRQRLIEEFERGDIDESDVPRDVLATLLRNQDRLDLPPTTFLREIAYFPWVGSHSTSNQLVHAMHHLFEWFETHPSSRASMLQDHDGLQRFVHESIRLHPMSPVALRRATTDVEICGQLVPADSEVSIDVEQANRDPLVFGSDADTFNPDRDLGSDATPWGLSFGHGIHACLGQELAGGLQPEPDASPRLLGSVSIMATRMLEHGAQPDRAEPPTNDETTTRSVWSRYPVVFR